MGSTWSQSGSWQEAVTKDDVRNAVRGFETWQKVQDELKASMSVQRSAPSTGTLLERVGGPDCVRRMVGTFVHKLYADEQLAVFLQDTDAVSLRAKQSTFMNWLFSPADQAQPTRHVRTAHLRLIKQRGFTEEHFERGLGYFEEAMREHGYTEVLVKEIMGKLRPYKDLAFTPLPRDAEDEKKWLIEERAKRGPAAVATTPPPGTPPPPSQEQTMQPQQRRITTPSAAAAAASAAGEEEQMPHSRTSPTHSAPSGTRPGPVTGPQEPPNQQPPRPHHHHHHQHHQSPQQPQMTPWQSPWQPWQPPQRLALQTGSGPDLTSLEPIGPLGPYGGGERTSELPSPSATPTAGTNTSTAAHSPTSTASFPAPSSVASETAAGGGLPPPAVPLQRPPASATEVVLPALSPRAASAGQLADGSHAAAAGLRVGARMGAGGGLGGSAAAAEFEGHSARSASGPSCPFTGARLSRPANSASDLPAGVAAAAAKGTWAAAAPPPPSPPLRLVSSGPTTPPGSRPGTGTGFIGGGGGSVPVSAVALPSPPLPPPASIRTLPPLPFPPPPPLPYAVSPMHPGPSTPRYGPVGQSGTS